MWKKIQYEKFLEFPYLAISVTVNVASSIGEMRLLLRDKDKSRTLEIPQTRKEGLIFFPWNRKEKTSAPTHI